MMRHTNRHARRRASGLICCALLLLASATARAADAPPVEDSATTKPSRLSIALPLITYSLYLSHLQNERPGMLYVLPLWCSWRGDWFVTAETQGLAMLLDFGLSGGDDPPILGKLNAGEDIPGYLPMLTLDLGVRSRRGGALTTGFGGRLHALYISSPPEVGSDYIANDSWFDTIAVGLGGSAHLTWQPHPNLEVEGQVRSGAELLRRSTGSGRDDDPALALFLDASAQGYAKIVDPMSAFVQLQLGAHYNFRDPLLLARMTAGIALTF